MGGGAAPSPHTPLQLSFFSKRQIFYWSLYFLILFIFLMFFEAERRKTILFCDLSMFDLFVYLPTYLSTYLPLYLATHLPIYLAIHLPIYRST